MCHYIRQKKTIHQKLANVTHKESLTFVRAGSLPEFDGCRAALFSPTFSSTASSSKVTSEETRLRLLMSYKI